MGGPEEDTAGSTAVTIFGQTYHLRGQGDPEYLRGLAEHVDRKMHELSRTTGTPDSLKLAVLAALNFADEAMTHGSRDVTSAGKSSDDEKRLQRMVRLLDEALAG